MNRADHWCPACAEYHHPEATFCQSRHEPVTAPATPEEIAANAVEDEAIERHNRRRASATQRKDWFWDGKQWRPRSRLEREHLEEGA